MALWLLTRAGTPLGVRSMQTPDVVRSPRHLCDTIVAAFSLGGWPSGVVAALHSNGQKIQLRARVQEHLIAAWLDSNTPSSPANIDFVLDACLDAATYHLGEPLRGLAGFEEQLRDGDRFGFQEVAGDDNDSIEAALNRHASDGFLSALEAIRDASARLVTHLAASEWRFVDSSDILQLESIGDLAATVAQDAALGTITVECASIPEQKHHVMVFPGLACCRGTGHKLFVSPGYHVELVLSVRRDDAPVVQCRALAAALADFEDAVVAVGGDAGGT